MSVAATYTLAAMETDQPIPSELRRHCADSALQCHATASIFASRAQPIRYGLRTLAFTGLAVPALVGAMVTTFNVKPGAFAIISVIAGVVSVIQLAVSIWALVSGWEGSFSYYLETKNENYRLSDEYAKLCKTTVLSRREFELEKASLDATAESRAALDNRFDISDAEKRRGMREGLFKFQRPCAVCKTVPKTRKPTTPCECCGTT